MGSSPLKIKIHGFCATWTLEGVVGPIAFPQVCESLNFTFVFLATSFLTLITTDHPQACCLSRTNTTELLDRPNCLQSSHGKDENSSRTTRRVIHVHSLARLTVIDRLTMWLQSARFHGTNRKLGSAAPLF
jgi:hypothetical protein